MLSNRSKSLEIGSMESVCIIIKLMQNIFEQQFSDDSLALLLDVDHSNCNFLFIQLILKKKYVIF